MSATSERDGAINLAKTDPAGAYKCARKIADPWFRCQALAWVAWMTADAALFLKIIAEAEDAARSAADPYQQVAASAWPMHALIERGRGAQGQKMMQTSLGRAIHIINPVSKADALFLLWQAAFPLGCQATQELLGSLLDACIAVKGWKGQYLLRAVALMLASTDSAAAERVLAVMRDGGDKRQAERRIAEGAFLSPRPFFRHGAEEPTSF